jgi:hypothetical protein
MRFTRKAAVVLTAVVCTALASLAYGDVVQHGNARISFKGELRPHTLPRDGAAPVNVSVGATISAVAGKPAPQLQRIKIAINRNGHLNTSGLPVCRLEEIQPSSTEDALRACGDSLVGDGYFTSKVFVKGQSQFPSAGKMYAFNARIHGRPAILGHVYGLDPVPTSFTIPFELRPSSKGTYGLLLTTSFPGVVKAGGYVTGLSLRLGREFSARGKSQSYLSAGCPAPKGVPRALFKFAHAEFSFSGGKTISSTLTRSCRARG